MAAPTSPSTSLWGTPDVAANSPDAAALHRTVMLAEVVEALQPRPTDFLAIDCTANGGGHCAALLERSSPSGQVLGLDADASALALAAIRLAPFGSRVRLIHSNFRHLADVAQQMDLPPAQAILFDLGLSSVQLDHTDRGFTFRGDQPLDMRFDVTANTPPASELLNSLDEEELARIFRDYGEEPRGRRLAHAVVWQRARTPFVRTGDLLETITRSFGPSRGHAHPAARVFQALRIAVNRELEALEAGLDAAIDLLAEGGRLAVISFHSLEDRLVKWRFRDWADTSSSREPRARILTKRPLRPSPDEVHANRRARSAKLRVIERILPPTPSSVMQGAA